VPRSARPSAGDWRNWAGDRRHRHRRAEYSAELARQQSERAIRALAPLADSPYKHGLIALARFAVEHTT
jgi:geranylgeranyl pyrophosphate synthase